MKICRVHDIVREFVMHKAKVMNFLMVCSKPDEWESCSKARRVAIHCTLDGNYAGPRIRSMLNFGATKALDCSNFRTLRVLCCLRAKEGIIELQSFKGAPLLRYLQWGTSIEGKESQFGKWVRGMKYLETLDLGVVQPAPVDLSDWIWHAKTLRHVFIPWNENSPTQGPPASVDLRNLQTLTWVIWNKSWEASSLPNISDLRELSIKIEGDISESVLSSFVGRQKHLANLSIDGDVIRKIVWRGTQFYKNLQSLTLEYYDNVDDSSLPATLIKLGDNMLPPNLIDLEIRGYEFGSDPMAVLEELGNLISLVLYGSSVNNENAARRIRCSSGGFKKLETLKLSDLPLEEWEIEWGAMPMLRRLTVYRCDQLRVPHELTHLQSLQFLKWETDVEANIDAISSICQQRPNLRLLA